MLTAQAFLSTCQYRAKGDDVGASDLPASWKQEDVRLVFKVLSILRVLLHVRLILILFACFRSRNDHLQCHGERYEFNHRPPKLTIRGIDQILMIYVRVSSEA